MRLRQIVQALQRHKYYPLTARRLGLTGRVRLQFTITEDGQIEEVRVLGDDSPALLQEVALLTLKRVKALPALPASFSRKSLQVEMPLVYQLVER
jgi:protein TonB